MDNISNIGTTAYEAAPRGDSLRRLRNGGTNSSTMDQLKFVFSCIVDCLTFLVLVTPIMLGYVFRLFVSRKEKKIAGQLALVTGGANGLGREIGLELAKKGCNVAVADLDMTNGEKTAEDIRKLGVQAQCYRVDVSDFDSVLELKRQIESTLGPVDILVNNAGVLPLMSVREGKPEDLKKVMEINLLSHFWTIRAFGEGMIERRRGHIVAIASVASFLPLGRMVSYVATKFGVHGLMESFKDEIHLEGLQDQIHMTTVYPFFMNTRKDLMSGLARINVIGRVPIYSPNLMACATVDAITHNEEQLFVPKISGALLKGYVLVPNKVRQLGQTLVFRTRLPRMMD
ncbi:uncharacterized oxidoreductase YoxD-like isoform X2 [Wyeomyia smithii]|uniref:uncharacterized oxidoreductase YoxD-like isoform X2 n=1 Tax=Wyeomyia smithii TaxID=174621 RepID=UPI002467F7BC|nr:uncharacterized oxidoreductase YoxD-like isoform X2 [Wyeomyia smithii]